MAGYPTILPTGTSAALASVVLAAGALAYDSTRGDLVLGNGKAGGAPFSSGVNVKALGAVGDGVTDDTSAIALAMATGRRVFFPAGTYKVTSPLTLKTGHNIIGESNRTTTILAVGVTAFYASAASMPAGSWNITIRDLTLRGSGSVANCDGVYFNGTSLNPAENTLENLIIQGFTRSGVTIERPIVTTLRNVHSENNGGDGFAFVGDGTSLTVIGCWAKSNNGCGFRVTNAIPYSSFIGCVAENCVQNGFYFNSSSLSAPCTNVTLVSCGVESCLGDFFRFDGCQGFTISSCYVYEGSPTVGGHFFYLNGCRYFNLSGVVADRTPTSGKYALAIGNNSGTYYSLGIVVTGCKFSSILNDNSALEMSSKGSASGVGDGSTITHYLGTTPSFVELSCGDANYNLDADTKNATTFRLLAVKHDGTTGSGLNVNWRAYA